VKKVLEKRESGRREKKAAETAEACVMGQKRTPIKEDKKDSHYYYRERSLSLKKKFRLNLVLR
jgi:hypothetical protein